MVITLTYLQVIVVYTPIWIYILKTHTLNLNLMEDPNLNISQIIFYDGVLQNINLFKILKTRVCITKNDIQTIKPPHFNSNS